MTLIEVRAPVDALAANGRRIAWINTHARCGRQLQILTLPSRRPVYVGSVSGSSCRRANIGAIALAADGRVLWQRLVAGGLTVLDVEVDTAALRAPQTDVVGTVEFLYSQPDPDFVESWPLPTASDGKAIVFYASCVGYCGRGLPARRSEGEAARERLDESGRNRAERSPLRRRYEERSVLQRRSGVVARRDEARLDLPRQPLDDQSERNGRPAAGDGGGAAQLGPRWHATRFRAGGGA